MTNTSKGFLKGNKSAIVTFIVTMILSGVLLLSGIIVSSVGSGSSGNSGSDVKSITTYTDYYLYSGENEFKFYSGSTGYRYIVLDDYYYVSSITVTDAYGTNIYTNYNVYSSTCKFYLANSGTIYITIKLSSGSSEFYIY